MIISKIKNNKIFRKNITRPQFYIFPQVRDLRVPVVRWMRNKTKRPLQYPIARPGLYFASIAPSLICVGIPSFVIPIGNICAGNTSRADNNSFNNSNHFSSFFLVNIDISSLNILFSGCSMSSVVQSSPISTIRS